jgi:hypothetical protein
MQDFSNQSGFMVTVWLVPILIAVTVFSFSMLGIKAKSRLIRVFFSLIAACTLIAILAIGFQMVHPSAR